MATLLNDRNELLFSASSRITGASVTLSSGAATSLVVPKAATAAVPASITLSATVTEYITPAYAWSYRFGTTGNFIALTGTTNPITVTSDAAFLTAAGTSTVVQYKVTVTETTSNIGVNQAEAILSIPILREGVDAINNVQVVLYRRTATTSAPAVITTGNATYTFTSGQIVGQPASWTQTIPDASQGGYLWAIEVAAASVARDYQFANTLWSSPVLYTKDGTSGANGTNTALIYAYKRTATAPADNPGTVDYSFATNTITTTTLANSWSKTIPSGTDPLYVTLATATSTGTTDSVAASEWTSPVILTQNGLNSAIVYLYARNNNSTTAPSLVTTGSVTYNFTTGALTGTIPPGWTQALPVASSGSVLWAIQATAANTSVTDTILNTEWGTPQVLAQNGLSGTAGTRGSRQLYSNNAAHNSTFVYLSNAAGAVSYAAKATALIAAATAGSVPTTPIEGDTVTFTNGSTYVYTITYNGSTQVWQTPGTVIDGSLLVTGSVTAAKINSNGLTIRNNDGTPIFEVGATAADNKLNLPPVINNTPLAWVNTNISISDSGVLSGAGGGQVSIGGLGYTGALDANKTSVDANGAIQGVSNGAGTLVSNSNINITAAGALNGAGGGQVTTSGLGIDTYRIVARGASTIYATAAGVYKNGIDTGSSSARSYNLATINRATNVYTKIDTYDTFAAASEATRLATALNALDSSVIVIVWTYDEPANNHLDGGLPEAMQRCGATPVVFGDIATGSIFKYRSAYILVGIPGIGVGNGAEAYNGSVDNATDAWVELSFSLYKGQLSGITGTYTPSKLSQFGYIGDKNATYGAQSGINLKDSSGTVIKDDAFRNNLINVDWWKRDANIPWSQNGEYNRIVSADPGGVGDLGESGPRGGNDLVWYCQEVSNNGANGGGWDASISSALDPNKTYRFVVAIKSGDMGAGSAFWGVNGVCDLNTTAVNPNPYFAILNKSSMQTDRWYLFVGYVFPYGSTGNSSNSAGIWDCKTGTKIWVGTNYCHTSTGATSHRAYQYYANQGANMRFSRPMINMVDGTEPSLREYFEEVAVLNSAVTASSINALSKNSADILSGTIDIDAATNAGIRVSPSGAKLTWNTTGAITGGRGIAITPAGIVGYNGSKTTFAIGADGNATFSGNLSAATGDFTGAVTATSGSFTGAVYATSGTFSGSLNVKSAASGARMEIKNNVIKVFDASGILRVQIGDLTA